MFICWISNRSEATEEKQRKIKRKLKFYNKDFPHKFNLFAKIVEITFSVKRKACCLIISLLPYWKHGSFPAEITRNKPCFQSVPGTIRNKRKRKHIFLHIKLFPLCSTTSLREQEARSPTPPPSTPPPTCFWTVPS